MIRNRRHILLAAGAVLCTPGLAYGAPKLVIETQYGKVRGVVEKGRRLFCGIPYGGDTSGKNRFMPPARPAAWAGVRDCTDWGHIAPQTVATSGASDYTRMVGWNNYRGGLSEDCLNLNVWAPLDGGKHAVMVAFHGGGFTSGSGNLVALEGDHLVREGSVVVVTVNHRLGALGYTDLSGVGGSAFATSPGASSARCMARICPCLSPIPTLTSAPIHPRRG